MVCKACTGTLFIRTASALWYLGPAYLRPDERRARAGGGGLGGLLGDCVAREQPLLPLQPGLLEGVGAAPAVQAITQLIFSTLLLGLTWGYDKVCDDSLDVAIVVPATLLWALSVRLAWYKLLKRRRSDQSSSRIAGWDREFRLL